MLDFATMEPNLVEKWLRKDPKRWFAGALAGILAGAIALAFSSVLASLGGKEFLYPLKIPALPLLGPAALTSGFQTSAIFVGLTVSGVLAALLGVLFAHFTPTNQLTALLGMGLAWGAFSWIFIHNLYAASWRSVYVAGISPGASGPALFVWMVFGVALTSVAFFDRLLRGGRS